MASMIRLRRRVEKLEQLFTPKPPEDLAIVWWAGSLDKPHGRYGYSKFHVHTQQQEALSEQEEVELLRQRYEEMEPHAKRVHDGYSWATFEDFLKSHECKCEKCQNQSKVKEMTDLLKRREETFEALTAGMTPAEKAEFELATVEEFVNSEDFKKLMQDYRNKNQPNQEGDNLP